jgi:hypothetical protein
MSQTFGAIGQGIASAGQAAGSAIARIPEEKRKQEEWDMKMKEFRDNKEYRIGEIEKVQMDANEFAKKIKMPTAKFLEMDDYFENLKKAPAATAAKKLGNISFYLSNYANQLDFAEKSGDQTLGDMARIDMDMSPSAWDDDNEIKTLGDRLAKQRELRKDGIINGLINEQVQIAKQAKKNPDAMTVKGAILSEGLKRYPGALDADTINERVDSYFESRDTIQKRNIDRMEAETKRLSAGATGGPKPTSQDDVLKDIQKQKQTSIKNALEIYKNVEAGFMSKGKAKEYAGRFDPSIAQADMVENIVVFGKEAGVQGDDNSGNISYAKATAMAKKLIEDTKKNRMSTDPDVMKIRAFLEKMDQGEVTENEMSLSSGGGVGRTPQSTTEGGKPPLSSFMGK